MTRESWIFSDPHFGHQNIIRFKKPDGSPIRPGWYDSAGVLRGFNDDIKYHDEMFIQRYNERVKPGDHVYCLGDWGHPLIEYSMRLNGKIRFIPGNHDDIHKFRDIERAFDKVYPVWRRYKKEDDFGFPVAFTHMPLHANNDDPTPRKISVHGHIHEKLILRPNGQPDPWYVNVCVEHTNFAPLHWDELKQRITANVNKLRALGEIE